MGARPANLHRAWFGFSPANGDDFAGRWLPDFYDQVRDARGVQRAGE